MFNKYLSYIVILLFISLFSIFSGCDFSSDITIIYSNDILAELENCGCDDKQLGSLSRKAAVIDSLKKTDKNILNLDAGNLFFSKKPLNKIEKNEFLLKSQYILKAYNQIGLDVLNIGEKDLIFGIDAITKLKKKSSFAFISANILNKNRNVPVFEPYVIKEIYGKKLGIIGLCGQADSLSPEISIEDPFKTAAKWVELITDKCDYIILLSALGLENDKKLAGQIKGISLIISAKSENSIEEPVLVKKTWITQTYKRGQQLGKLKVTLKKKSEFKIKNSLIPLDSSTGENQEIKNIVKNYKAALISINKQEFLKAALTSKGGNPPDSIYYLGAEKCGECHIPQYENWQQTFHAEAYATLQEEENNYSVECLPCHTTGYGEPGGFDVYQGTESSFSNVQCESCHGPGSNHSEKNGIIRNIGEKGCVICHDNKNSPEFDYNAYLPMVKCPTNM
jgi:hypothetical protein